MNNCGKCKYFGKAQEAFDEDGDEYETKYHICEKIKHVEYIKEFDSNAGVIDGSGYYAALIVSSDFGCINFKIGASNAK